MFSKRFQIGCVLIVLVNGSFAGASENGLDHGESREYYRPVAPLPPSLGFTYHHSSTAREGKLRGEADVIHATGNYWLAVSQALICREQVRALALGNQQRWIEYRTALRAWHEWEQKHRNIEQRRVNDARRPQKYAVYRLRSDQLDRRTGAITWPIVLQTAEFDDLRNHLETLFREQARYAAVPIATSGEITQCTETFRDSLHRRHGEIDRDDYLAALKFLCGLKYEATLRLAELGPDNQRPIATSEELRKTTASAQLPPSR